MVSINYAFKEICCKIIFYGPGLSGKTTNLQYVHQKIPPQTRGELISLATDQDRTLYFDFLPVNIGKIHGFAIKFPLSTVPGQVYYNATRKLVLRGVDGLVFVADSQRSKMDENIESYQNLVENLDGYGYDIGKLPLVFQYNKRDLSDISSVDELERTLNPKGIPYFEAVASQGAGVFDTLKCISKLVLDLAKGKRVVPEEEVPVKEAVMVEAKAVPAETGMSLRELRTPASVSLFSEEPELLEKKEAEPTLKEKQPHALEEEGGSPQTCESPDGWGGMPAQPKTEFEPSLKEEKVIETEKQKRVSGGLTYGGDERKAASGPSRLKADESPTIISWSAARQKKKVEPKGFFLWRFIKKLLNR